MRQDKTTPTRSHADTTPHELSDQMLRIEFTADPKARAEFMSFADFAAFRRAQASGRVRMLVRPS